MKNSGINLDKFLVMKRTEFSKWKRQLLHFQKFPTMNILFNFIFLLDFHFQDERFACWKFSQGISSLHIFVTVFKFFGIIVELKVPHV